MSNFISIDSAQLVNVIGGDGRTTTAGAEVNVPGVGTASVNASQTTQESSRYLRCLDQVNRNAGMFESPNRIEQRQQLQCGPLIAKE